MIVTCDLLYKERGQLRFFGLTELLLKPAITEDNEIAVEARLVVSLLHGLTQQLSKTGVPVPSNGSIAFTTSEHSLDSSSTYEIFGTGA